jgi:hypothetical protein
VLVGVAMLQSSAFDPWLAWPGITIGVLLAAGSVEFVGSFEEKGWKTRRCDRPHRPHRMVALAGGHRDRPSRCLGRATPSGS